MRRLESSPALRLGADDLRRMGVDPARARRYFLQRHGMTFQAYCRAHRLSEAFRRIQGGDTVSDGVRVSGWGLESDFQPAYARVLGGPPADAGNRNLITLSWIRTVLGSLVVGTTAQGVCLLEFSDRRMLETQLRTLRRRFCAALMPGSNGVVIALQQQLEEYFSGDRKRFTIPLSYPGTPFQNKVWSSLLDIPYGSTRSYRELACEVGHPQAVRAVGTANGMNRIAILIPCHRVVNTNGELGGYGGGLWRKRMLLDLESGQRSPAPLVKYTANVPSQ
jgi:AraC family transcriptional regulator of adaptative response/methylated-DNA-[protein]-cysteine methyltransferase